MILSGQKSWVLGARFTYRVLDVISIGVQDAIIEEEEMVVDSEEWERGAREFLDGFVDYFEDELMDEYWGLSALFDGKLMEVVVE